MSPGIMLSWPATSSVTLGFASTLAILTLTLVALKCPAPPIRTRFHVRRMLFHALIGIGCACIGQWILPPFVATIVLTIVLILFGLLHIARRMVPSFNAIFNRYFSSILRPHEHHELPTAFYFLLSIDIVVTFFALPVAVLSTLFLAIGDPVASLFGKWLQKPDSIRFRNGKTLIGGAANFTACLIVAFAYLYYVERLPLSYIPAQSIAGALTASITECSVFSNMIDDNLTIPILSAIALTVTRACSHI